jgi:FtsZ-interacting cell division protein YlmF
MFNLNKWWLGPEEKVFNEGFDSLFAVENSEIPYAKPEIKTEVNKLNSSNSEAKKDTSMTNNFNLQKRHLEAVQPKSNSMNIVVQDPKSFEDSMKIVENLKERNTVIVNLQYLDKEMSQRVIDFVSGAAVALNGSYERVGSGVFIFAPINCNLSNVDHKEDVYRELFGKQLKTF